MTSQEFTRAVIDDVVEGNQSEYQRLFSMTLDDQVTDPHWRSALAFFAVLSESQRLVFFSILRQVSVDTAATLFAILDGTCQLAGRFEEFQLLDSDASRLEDLQDHFLSQEEGL